MEYTFNKRTVHTIDQAKIKSLERINKIGKSLAKLNKIILKVKTRDDNGQLQQAPSRDY